MKVLLVGTILLLGIFSSACGGVQDGSNTRANQAIKTNTAGPQPTVGNATTNANAVDTNLNAATDR